MSRENRSVCVRGRGVVAASEDAEGRRRAGVGTDVMWAVCGDAQQLRVTHALGCKERVSTSGQRGRNVCLQQSFLDGTMVNCGPPGRALYFFFLNTPRYDGPCKGSCSTRSCYDSRAGIYTCDGYSELSKRSAHTISLHWQRTRRAQCSEVFDVRGTHYLDM